jgi:hypothetical protein
MEFFGVTADVLFPEVFVLNGVSRHRPDTKAFKPA